MLWIDKPTAELERRSHTFTHTRIKIYFLYLQKSGKDLIEEFDFSNYFQNVHDVTLNRAILLVTAISHRSCTVVLCCYHLQQGKDQ